MRLYTLAVLSVCLLTPSSGWAVKLKPQCSPPKKLNLLGAGTAKNPIALGNEHIAYTTDDTLRRFRFSVANLRTGREYQLPMDVNDAGHFYGTGEEDVLAFTDGYWGYYKDKTRKLIEWPKLLVVDLGPNKDSATDDRIAKITLHQQGHRNALLLNHLRVERATHAFFRQQSGSFDYYTISWRVMGWGVGVLDHRFCTVVKNRSTRLQVYNDCDNRFTSVPVVNKLSGFDNAVTASVPGPYEGALTTYRGIQRNVDMTRFTREVPSYIAQGDGFVNTGWLYQNAPANGNKIYNVASFAYLGASLAGDLLTFANHDHGLDVGFDPLRRGKIHRERLFSDKAVRRSFITPDSLNWSGLSFVGGSAVSSTFNRNNDLVTKTYVYALPNLWHRLTADVFANFFPRMSQPLGWHDGWTSLSHDSDKTNANAMAIVRNKIRIYKGVHQPLQYFNSDIWMSECSLGLN